MQFKGEYTRFENDDDPNLPPTEGGEIRGADDILFSSEEYDPFKLAGRVGY
jgi:hypothetical protein